MAFMLGLAHGAQQPYLVTFLINADIVEYFPTMLASLLAVEVLESYPGVCPSFGTLHNNIGQNMIILFTSPYP